MAIIVGGGMMRFAMAAAATGGTSLTPSERLFVGLAWIPKATVQAALGAAALEQALEENAGPQCVFFPSSFPSGQCVLCGSSGPARSFRALVQRKSICGLRGTAPRCRMRTHTYTRRQVRCVDSLLAGRHGFHPSVNPASARAGRRRGGETFWPLARWSSC
jgi:hypothetical protein